MMKRKFMVAALAVCMLAGWAQAADYIPPEFTISTSNFGDVTIVGASLDGVGNDTTPEAYRHTVAADGALDWAGDINNGPGAQYHPHTTFETATQEPNGLDPIPFGIWATDYQEPELITTVDVDEGWYRVFVAYAGAIFARQSADREFTPFTGCDPIYGGDQTPVGTLVVDELGSVSELIDHTSTRTNNWQAMLGEVGYQKGSQLVLRTAIHNRIGSRIPSGNPATGGYMQPVLFGIGYQPVYKEVVIEEPNNVANEGGAGGSITVQLTDAPSANVEVTLTPDSDEYAVGGAAAGAPKVLTFTPGDWAAQTVAITAPDDADADNHNGLLAVTVSSPGGDADYDGDAVDSLEVTVVDDDMPAAIPGLIGWWKLDGDAQDSSGNGNHGVLMDLENPQDQHFVSGMDGLALQTNHAGTPWVEVTPADPNLYIPDDTDGLTVSFWFRQSPWNSGGWGWFISVGNYADMNETCWYSRMWGNANVHFGVYGADGNAPGSLSGDNILRDKQWHHLVGVWDKAKGQVRKYHDGIQQPEAPPGDQFPVAGVNLRPNYAAQPLRLLYSNLPNYPTRGVWMDDVRIYDHVLSGAEIAQLHYDVTGEVVCMKDLGPLDSNDDCKIDVVDLSVMLEDWLTCNVFPQSDCGVYQPD